MSLPLPALPSVQHLSGPAAAASLARLGLTAVSNPAHLLPDLPLLRSRLGGARAGGPGHSYALHTMQVGW